MSNGKPLAVMRQSWVAGRAVLCPPHDGSVTLIPLPMPDGGQRSARPAFGNPPMNDALPLASISQGGLDLWLEQSFDFLAGRQMLLDVPLITFPGFLPTIGQSDRLIPGRPRVLRQR